MNYKETAGAATKWRRAHRVTITNPYQGTANVVFEEQDMLTFGDQSIELPGGALAGMPSVVCEEFDPAGVISLINPETGEPTGETVPQAVLYVALFSLYMQAAAKRDALLAAQP